MIRKELSWVIKNAHSAKIRAIETDTSTLMSDRAVELSTENITQSFSILKVTLH